ncbi:MAG: hypothetical protein AABN95_16845, partial [Acidobacteriota bacterium]
MKTAGLPGREKPPAANHRINQGPSVSRELREMIRSSLNQQEIQFVLEPFDRFVTFDDDTFFR